MKNLLLSILICAFFVIGVSGAAHAGFSESKCVHAMQTVVSPDGGDCDNGDGGAVPDHDGACDCFCHHVHAVVPSAIAGSFALPVSALAVPRLSDVREGHGARSLYRPPIV